MCNAARRRACNYAILLVLVLVALLFSAGSDHHRADRATVVPVASSEEPALDGPGEHPHHHGSEWTPTTTSRIRVVEPAATTVYPGHEPTATPATGDASPFLTVLSHVRELAQPGVLRV
ncbi:hypothetical protein AFR_14640 [Actinoplanes friuliensis DSM 7358]|uniref:Uncharacterized protein n=1 Tax=Actinoplanes friuliensis DSM 7358 TaxID=1246995 RepID=U5VZR6_9ACTN|nr:hypothetical protein AFR_14640 [Actinoplanes friuliensis DSM 7358]